MIKRFNEFKHINEGLKDSYLFGSNLVYYTGDYNTNEIKRTYKVLFDSGYTFGGKNKIEEVYERELKCTLLFIYPKYKTVLYVDANDYNDGYSPELIYDLINRCGLNRDDWYLIKNKFDFNKIFNVPFDYKSYFNTKRNIYD